MVKRVDQTLDFLRWTSALLVAISHLRGFLFVDTEPSIFSEHITATLVATKVFYFITSLGNEAVIVFFVISGYLIGGKLLEDGVSWEKLPDYFSHRISRIYIVLIPALALTLFFDLAGAQLASGPLLYDHADWSLNLNFVTSDNHGLGTLVCNLANLQLELCSAYGSNGPLWSLAYEWFYYVTFPLLLLLMPSVKTSVASVVGWFCWLSAVILLAVLFRHFTFFYGIWIAGAAARLAHDRKLIPLWLSYLGLAGLAFCVLYLRYYAGLGLHLNFLMGGALALFLCNDHNWIGARGNIDSKLASFSYSLYVTHHPLMLFILSALLSTGVISGRQTPSFHAISILAVMLMVTYIVAWGFSLLTERHTQALRITLLRTYRSIFGDRASLDIVK